MPKKPGTNSKGEFAFFNVVYEDDSQRSNRRVPSELLFESVDEARRAETVRRESHKRRKSSANALTAAGKPPADGCLGEDRNGSGRDVSPPRRQTPACGLERGK